MSFREILHIRSVAGSVAGLAKAIEASAGTLDSDTYIELYRNAEVPGDAAVHIVSATLPYGPSPVCERLAEYCRESGMVHISRWKALDSDD